MSTPHVRGRMRPLPPAEHFIRRMLQSAALAAAMVAVGLGLGSLGYHNLEGLPWLDATLNAAMLLAGEGPLKAPETVAGKVFATVYAIFSGVLFVTATSVIIAPAFYRFLHRFHLETTDDGQP